MTTRTFSVVGRPGSSTRPSTFDAGERELLAEPRGGAVRADDADERRPAAERGDVVRHVRRASQAHVLRLELHDRDRRFGRDARHAADDEAIEHDVADDEHRLAGEAPDEIARAARGEPGERHAAADRSAAANGSVTISRNSIRNFGVPEVVLEQSRR